MIGRTTTFFFTLGALILLTQDPLVVSPDMGWHIRAGERIVQSLSIPKTAWFTFSVPNFQWIDHEWAQQIFIYGAWHYLGLPGVRLLFGTLGITLAILVLWPLRTAACDRRLTSLLVIAVAGILVATRMLRPQIVSALFFQLLLLLIFQWRTAGRARALWATPLLFLLWCNLHAGYPVGFLLLASVFLGDIMEPLARRLFKRPASSAIHPKSSLRALAPIGILSLLVTAMNPYGLRIYEEIFRTVRDRYPATIVTEWLPTSLASHSGEGFFLTATALLILYLLRFLRLSFCDVLLLAVFFCFGLSATRHTIFFILLAIHFMLRAAPKLQPLVVKEIRLVTISVTALAIVLTVGFLASQRYPGSAVINQSARMYPVAALDTLAGSEVGKRLFHNVEWGGYLVLHNPANQTFIDGRMTQWIINGESFLSRYVQTKDAKPGWTETLERYGINMVMLRPQEPLSKALRSLQDTWELIYEDEIAVVFVSTPQENSEIMKTTRSPLVETIETPSTAYRSSIEAAQ